MKPHKRLTVANITSVLALIIALAGTGGAAYALGKNTVGSPQIINGQVKTKDLDSNSVATKKIQKSAVTGAKVKNRSLSGDDLAPRATGVVQAGAEVTQEGGVAKQFNRLGNAVTVSKTGPGQYTVAIPGAASGAKIVGVTPRDFDTYCQATDAASASISVTCRFVGSSQLLDSRFSIYLIH